MSARIDHLERDAVVHVEQGKQLNNLDRKLGELSVEVREARHHLDAKIETICQDFKRLSDTMARMAASRPASSTRADFMEDLRNLMGRYANG